MELFAISCLKERNLKLLTFHLRSWIGTICICLLLLSIAAPAIDPTDDGEVKSFKRNNYNWNRKYYFSFIQSCSVIDNFISLIFVFSITFS